MSNYVIKYTRGDAVKYISHLDFVRMFHRAVRRSGLHMVFSGGFNPHPIMTVAMPLSVGVTSDGEYMKIAFEDGHGYTEEGIKDRLNGALPAGFTVLAVQRVEGKELDFTKLDRADYIVEALLEQECTVDVEAFLQNRQLLVMKKSKSGVKEADIRPHIYQMQLLKQDGRTIVLSMRLAAGNAYNLKPDTVLDAMGKYIDGFNSAFFMVHRKAILAGEREYL